MKLSAFSPLLPLAAAAFIAAVFTPFQLAATENGHSPATPVATSELVPVNDHTAAAWLAKARADYPMDSCSVSGDKFDSGEMGKPQDYVYQQPGKPDRLIRFCCKDCIVDFKKDPAKYLKIIDEATAAKTPATKK